MFYTTLIQDYLQFGTEHWNFDSSEILWEESYSIFQNQGDGLKELDNHEEGFALKR